MTFKEHGSGSDSSHRVVFSGERVQPGITAVVPSPITRPVRATTVVPSPPRESVDEKKIVAARSLEKAAPSELAVLDPTFTSEKPNVAGVETPNDVGLGKSRAVVVAGHKLPTNGRGEYCIPEGFSVADSGQSSHEFVLLTWEDGSWAVIKDVGSPGADDTRGEGGLAKRLEDALGEWVAEGLVEPGWRMCTELWVPEVSGGMVSLAEGLVTAQERWHDVPGESVPHVSEVMGVDPVLSNVLGGIARKVALPGDTWIKDMKRAVQYSGIAIGAISGNYILVDFFLKSLIHDSIIEKASKGVRRVLSGDS